MDSKSNSLQNSIFGTSLTTECVITTCIVWLLVAVAAAAARRHEVIR